MWAYQTSVEVWGSPDKPDSLVGYVALIVSSLDGENATVWFNQQELLTFMNHLAGAYEQCDDLLDETRKGIDEDAISLDDLPPDPL